MPARIAKIKPLAELQQFARALGWSRLRMFQHTLQDAPGKSKIITWYESGFNDGGKLALFLQINEHPIGTLRTYNAAVYAMRYRMCTGWLPFRLTAALQHDPNESECLAGRLHRKWFQTIEARREFRVKHPECVGYSWKRIGEIGPPQPRGIAESPTLRK